MRISIPSSRTLKKLCLWGLAFAGLGYFAASDIAPMPGFHFLSKDSDYSSSTTGNGYSGKYGEKYKNYLIGVNQTSEGINNDAWWEWLFEYRYQPNKDDIWDKFSRNLRDKEAVKNKCIEAYKTEYSKINQEEETSNSFWEHNIWILCSPFGAKPTSLKFDENYGGQIVKNKSYKKVLISITSTSYSNNMFWNLKQKEFLADNDFKSETKTVKEWCKEAYTLKTIPPSGGSPQSKFTEDNIFKWCSLEGKKPSDTPKP